MTEFGRHEKARAEARKKADATGEPWCVCLLCGKYFARPERKALKVVRNQSGASIQDTFAPQGDSA